MIHAHQIEKINSLAQPNVLANGVSVFMFFTVLANCIPVFMLFIDFS